jgi:hypothetical protein
MFENIVKPKMIVSAALPLLLFLLGCQTVRMQDTETPKIPENPEKLTFQTEFSFNDSEMSPVVEIFKPVSPAEPEENSEVADLEEFEFLKPERDFHRFLQTEKTEKMFAGEKDSKAIRFEPFENRRTPNGNPPEEKFHWKPALIESLYFLGIQHGFRMVQKKTRRELDGKFFADWKKSAGNLGGWRDGDSFLTNYIAHPMQGAVTGRIFLNHSDRSRGLEFENTKEYWESRFKAFVWSSFWSTQFELGPLSEASIGNVGLYDRTGPNRMGWVDLVVTPTAGTAVLIGEDLIDRYLLKNRFERGANRRKVLILRTFLTPFRSFTNFLGGKYPWKRYDRP